MYFIPQKTYPTAERAVAELEKMGIVTEITNQKRNRVFLADEILRIVGDAKA